MWVYFLEDKKTLPQTRFIEGRVEEVEELFGSRLPILPEGEARPGRKGVFLVELHIKLKTLAKEFTHYLYNSLTERKSAETVHIGDTLAPSHPYAKYLILLTDILSNTIENERRIGLLNLFWLGHSKEVSQVINEYYGQKEIKTYVKYQMHPLFRDLYRNAMDRALRRFETSQPEKLRYNLGKDFNFRLIESIIDDQLPLTELGTSTINLSNILIEQNRRFRISFREFKEIFSICHERLRKGIMEKDGSLLGRLKKHLPTIFHEHEKYWDEKAMVKAIFNTHVLNYLLLDYEEVGPKIFASPVLKGSWEKGKTWGEFLDGYMDLVQALKRTEVIDILRQEITLVPLGFDETQWRAHFSEGRLYRFQEATEVLNTIRKVTILFADLRGFTKVSEGGVSEKELTQHLYQLFDPLASIVRRFGGKIDKFTGDGVMIIFGVERPSGEDELNAIRTAVCIQELLSQMRHEGKTNFQMGISVHTGRAQLARFIVDEKNIDATVIGRNVNIAGRLSASFTGRHPAGWFEEQPEVKSFYALDEEGLKEKGPVKGRTVKGVTVDGDGNLTNTGIALSQDTVNELLKSINAQIIDGEGKWAFLDEGLKKNILIEYVGDVKFKGLERVVPVYSVYCASPL